MEKKGNRNSPVVRGTLTESKKGEYLKIFARSQLHFIFIIMMFVLKLNIYQSVNLLFDM